MFLVLRLREEEGGPHIDHLPHQKSAKHVRHTIAVEYGHGAGAENGIAVVVVNVVVILAKVADGEAKENYWERRQTERALPDPYTVISKIIFLAK